MPILGGGPGPDACLKDSDKNKDLSLWTGGHYLVIIEVPVRTKRRRHHHHCHEVAWAQQRITKRGQG